MSATSSTTRSPMDPRAAGQALDQVASFLELRGENPFRVRAFRTAARVVGGLPGSLRDALDDGSLAATKGVGPATLEIIDELERTGRSRLLEDLREQVPPGLIEMLEISGLGIAKIRQIHETLGIDSLPELEDAARDGRLARLPRFGAKTAENILKGIAFLRRSSAFQLFHHAEEEAETLRTALERIDGVRRATIVGDVRRRMEVVREVAVVLVADASPGEVFARLASIPGVQEISGQDERRVTLRFGGGGIAQVIVTTPRNAGAVLVQATGSEAHLAQLAEHAATRGHSLQGAALWHGSTFVPTPDEQALYAALGLAEIPPEMREGTGEVAAAAARALPTLLEPADLRGFLHCHTSWSDGSNSVLELATAIRDAGYEWGGITDHSQAAAYAGGLSADDLQKQADEIDAANEALAPFRVLKGVEADILVDGALDYPDDVLARLDFVIGSVHSRFGLSQAEMTARVVRAVRHPALTILGHPTGRLLLSREAYALDMEAVLEAAAAAGTAVEINADPHRLDLDWRWLRQAVEGGVTISIGADAHNIAGIANMRFGVGIARKGWLQAGHVLNTRPVEAMLDFAGKAGR